MRQSHLTVESLGVSELWFKPQQPSCSAVAETAHYSLDLLGSGDPPASASQVAVTTSERHHTQRIFVFIKTGFHYVAPAGLKLLGSSDLPASASQDVIRHFSPSVLMPVCSTGKRVVPHDGAKDLWIQARELVRNMKENPQLDFELDWKLINVFFSNTSQCYLCPSAQQDAEAGLLPRWPCHLWDQLVLFATQAKAQACCELDQESRAGSPTSTGTMDVEQMVSEDASRQSSPGLFRKERAMFDVMLLERLRQENPLNPGGRGCSEPRLPHCTPAPLTERDSISKKKKRKRKKR
ncbi:Phospholipase B1, membrane-associated [Plecturocebus cupreus]